MKGKIDWITNIGFTFEVIFFVLAGVFLFINLYIFFSSYILGLILAYFVGQRMINRVIKRMNKK